MVIFLYDSVWQVIADATIADHCRKITDKHTTDTNQVNGVVTWQMLAYWATAASLILVSGLLKVVYLCMKYTQDLSIDESDQSHRTCMRPSMVFVHAWICYIHVGTHMYFWRLPVGSELPWGKIICRNSFTADLPDHGVFCLIGRGAMNSGLSQGDSGRDCFGLWVNMTTIIYCMVT